MPEHTVSVCGCDLLFLSAICGALICQICRAVVTDLRYRLSQIIRYEFTILYTTLPILNGSHIESDRLPFVIEAFFADFSTERESAYTFGRS